MRLNVRTHQVLLVSLAIWIWQFPVQAVPLLQDMSAELSRARSFYNANQFQESLILLTELEKRIGADPQKSGDLLDVKVYLALSYFGLKQNDQAKAKFVEVCRLDNSYLPNPKDYPMQAIALYNEAKASCARNPRPATSSANTSIAQSIFVQGKDLYDSGKFTDALKYFSVVLAMDSSHDLAREYSELVQQRLDVLAERGYIEWRTSFDAREFDKAAAAYGRIRADQQLGGGPLPGRIASEYEKALSVLVSSWMEACSTRDRGKLDSIPQEALTIASGLPFGHDALDQMEPCPAQSDAPVAATPLATASSPLVPATSVAETPAEAPKLSPASPLISSTCLQGDPVLAIARLKTRVNPQIEPGLQRYIGRGIVVRVRIDEQGNVEVKEVAKANPRIADAIKAAVGQWKFNPTIIDNQIRCVETEIPISVIQH